MKSYQTTLIYEHIIYGLEYIPYAKKLKIPNNKSIMRLTSVRIVLILQVVLNYVKQFFK